MNNDVVKYITRYWLFEVIFHLTVYSLNIEPAKPFLEVCLNLVYYMELSFDFLFFSEI